MYVCIDTSSRCIFTTQPVHACINHITAINSVQRPLTQIVMCIVHVAHKTKRQLNSSEQMSSNAGRDLNDS